MGLDPVVRPMRSPLDCQVIDRPGAFEEALQPRCGSVRSQGAGPCVGQGGSDPDEGIGCPSADGEDARMNPGQCRGIDHGQDMAWVHAKVQHLLSSDYESVLPPQSEHLAHNFMLIHVFTVHLRTRDCQCPCSEWSDSVAVDY